SCSIFSIGGGTVIFLLVVSFFRFLSVRKDDNIPSLSPLELTVTSSNPSLDINAVMIHRPATIVSALLRLIASALLAISSGFCFQKSLLIELIDSYLNL